MKLVLMNQFFPPAHAPTGVLLSHLNMDDKNQNSRGRCELMQVFGEGEE